MKNNLLVPSERIVSRIFLVRDKKIMLDRDLAKLYGVSTKAMNQAVKRNLGRFPNDFMFRLTKEETKEFLRSQIVTLKRGQHYKYLPMAFTEQGVAMLSSVLNSERAILVNIQIIRIFTRMRNLLTHYKDLKEKIEAMEHKYDKQFQAIFEVIKRLIQEDEKPKKIIGFK